MKSTLMMMLMTTLLATGCATQTPQPEPLPEDPSKALQQEMLNSFMQQKLSQNGPSLLCDQSSYTSCYNISHQQCLQEVSSKNAFCVEKANTTFNGFTPENAKSYGKYYGACIAFAHMMMHSNKLQEIGACLKDAKLEKSKVVESLMK